MPPLVWTKFNIPPIRTKSVLRPRLLEKLNEGLSGRLILISAPAGFGKTTLVVQWLQTISLPALWITLEEGDDDPARFFNAWVVCLKRIDSSYCEDIFRTLNTAQLPPTEILTTELINGLTAIPTPFLIVLDDFQFISNPLITQFIQFSITHLPPHIHLVILTREDPPLPLTRLRLQKELTEIRTRDLRFENHESQQLFQDVLGISLEAKLITALTERTEGWAAGLQLAALSLQESPQPAQLLEDFSGNRFMLNYLAEEVLNKQPPHIQDFLLKTSILSTLTPEACNLLTSREDSADLLEKLFKSNLFIQPLDEQFRYYRYHSLFAELLRNRLNRLPLAEIQKLHLLAAEACQKEGFLQQSLQHLLTARNYHAVLDLLVENIWHWINHTPPADIEGWLAQLPPELQNSQPRLLLGLGWLYLMRGNFARLNSIIRLLQTILADSESTSAEWVALKAEFFALQANFLQVQQQYQQATQLAEHSLRLIQNGNERIAALAYLALGAGHRQAGNYEMARMALEKAISLSRKLDDSVTDILAVSHLTLMALEHGQLELAATTAQQAIQHLEQHPHGYPPVLGAVYGALGWVYYHRAEMDRAIQYFQRGIYLASLSGHNASAVYSLVGLARLWLSRHMLTQADEHLQKAQDFLQKGAPGWVIPELIFCKCRLAIAKGNPAEAEAILSASGISGDSPVSPFSEAIHLGWLSFYTHSDQPHHWRQGTALAERLVEFTRPHHRDHTLLQALVLGAILMQRVGNPAQAQIWLEEAVHLAGRNGYKSIFIEQRHHLTPLLIKIAPLSKNKTLLQYVAEQEAALSPDTPVLKKEAAYNPLSERELEVLRLLAEGLTYHQIAGRLVVSLNTVRFHVKGIYGKLGVNRLGQAVSEARRRGLI
ncbi:MAG: LuxR C-terminal-related transcriptional regulator [Chloroflexota bacterium]